MTEVAIVLTTVFFALLLLNVPIATAIGIASLAAVFANGGSIAPEVIVADRMIGGVGSCALLAIPFFVLSGILMGRGGMARRLIDFAAALVGRFPGGLAYVNTLTCMLFGSISGSATAAVSSVGGFMIPEMTRMGYNREFSVAVTTTAATTGLIIPPSNIMIVYSVACGTVSIAAMFIAGVLPGILLGLCGQPLIDQHGSGEGFHLWSGVPVEETSSIEGSRIKKAETIRQRFLQPHIRGRIPNRGYGEIDVEARTGRCAMLGSMMIAARGGHKLHIRKIVCHTLRGDPLIGILTMVVINIHHETIGGDEPVGGALITLVVGCHMVKAGCCLELRRGSDDGLVRIVGV